MNTAEFVVIGEAGHVVLVGESEMVMYKITTRLAKTSASLI